MLKAYTLLEVQGPGGNLRAFRKEPGDLRYLDGCAKTKSNGCLGTCSFLSSLKGKGRGGMATMGKESRLWGLIGLGEGQFVAYSYSQ